MQFTMPSVTIFYSGIFGLLLLVLSLNIFREWVHIAVGMQNEKNDSWKRSERIQQSFVEFVPMCMLLILLIEMNGAPALVLHGLGLGLVIARVLHAYGVGDGKLANIFRVVGTQMTFLILMISSLAAIYYAIVPLLVGI
jgi:uncharacterized membrane protein YecN with MAPEG domain